MLSLSLSKVGPHLWNRPTSGTLYKKQVHESRGHTCLVLCLTSYHETCIYSFIYSPLQWLTFMLSHQHPIRFSIPSENVSKCVIHCLRSLKMIKMNGFVALGVNLHFSGKLSYAELLISSQCYHSFASYSTLNVSKPFANVNLIQSSVWSRSYCCQHFIGEKAETQKSEILSLGARIWWVTDPGFSRPWVAGAHATSVLFR